MNKTPLAFEAFIVLIIVGVLNFVAEKLYLYWITGWFDSVVHFCAGACVGFTVLLIWNMREKISYPVTFRQIFLTAFLGALIIGLLWEVYEIAFGITTFADGIKYVTDTISDIIMDVLGGTVAAWYSVRVLNSRN